MIPSVYVSVEAVEDGTISLLVEASSDNEARAIAAAIAAAYIRDQGPGRIKTAAGRSSGFQSVSSLLSTPQEVAVAMGMALLASAAILVLPLPRLADLHLLIGQRSAKNADRSPTSPGPGSPSAG